MCRERTHSLTRFLCLASVRKEREDQEEEQRKRRLAAAEAEEKVRGRQCPRLVVCALPLRLSPVAGILH